MAIYLQRVLKMRLELLQVKREILMLQLQMQPFADGDATTAAIVTADDTFTVKVTSMSFSK